MIRDCSTKGKKSNSYRLFAGKPEENGPDGWPSCRLVNNIKIEFRDTGFGGNDWIDLAQDWDQWRSLRIWLRTFGFNNLLGSSRAATQLAASQEGLNSTKLVDYLNKSKLYL
jgi:hypothetical protein